MKKFKNLFLVLLAVWMLSSTAFAGTQNFTFVNYSGKTIHYLYVSRSDHSGWEEDLLGSSVLKHGDSRKINFSNTERGRFWDVKVVFSDNKSWVWNGIDLQTVYKMVIDGKGTAHYN